MLYSLTVCKSVMHDYDGNLVSRLVPAALCTMCVCACVYRSEHNGTKQIRAGENEKSANGSIDGAVSELCGSILIRCTRLWTQETIFLSQYPPLTHVMQVWIFYVDSIVYFLIELHFNGTSQTNHVQSAARRIDLDTYIVLTSERFTFPV